MVQAGLELIYVAKAGLQIYSDLQSAGTTGMCTLIEVWMLSS